MKKIIFVLFISVLLAVSAACNEGSGTSEGDYSFVQQSAVTEASPDMSESASVAEASGGADSSEASEISEISEISEVSEVSEISEVSEVSLPEASIPEASFPTEASEDNTEYETVFFDSGFVLYNGAAYTQSFYSARWAPEYAKVYAEYKELFGETRISPIIAPLASITITDTSVSSRMSDQGALLDKTEATIIGDVNFVNLKDVYKEHADEYLFFRSDHHWTQRGAYYAYSEFAKSVGLTPTPIESFEKRILRENFIGSMLNYVGDERVGTYYDTVEAYYSTKACTMTVTHKNGTTTTYNTCIVDSYKSYSAFIAGDYPLVTINVPANDQDKSILVIKDSYGNAFVPFLTEHYGNIYVIDPRHTDVNVYDIYKDYGLDDIVFLVNSSMGNTGEWCNYFKGLID